MPQNQTKMKAPIILFFWMFPFLLAAQSNCGQRFVAWEKAGCWRQGFGSIVPFENNRMAQGMEGGWNTPQIQKLGSLSDPMYYYVLDGTGTIQRMGDLKPLVLPDAVAFKMLGSENKVFIQSLSGQIQYFEWSGYLYLEYPVQTPDALPIASEVGSVFDVADLDCDGKLDLIFGKSDGTVQFYKGRQGIEQPVNGALTFEIPQTQFAGIQLTGTSCTLNKGKDESFKRHGSSAISVVDFDGDGDKDIFWGDTFTDGLLKLVNVGTCQNPQFEVPQSDTAYPNYYFPPDFKSTGLNKAEFFDADSDGDLDLGISVLDGFCRDVNQNEINNLFFYQNDAGTYRPMSNLLKSFDVGKRSVPAVVDVDGDGDDDVVIGVESQAPNGYGKLVLLENIGGQFARFNIKDENWLNIQNLFNLSPTFADVDADTDADLFIGDQSGKIRFYEKTALGYILNANQWLNIDVGTEAAPTFADIDGDHDLDLFVGDARGKINFYRNEGTAQQGNWLQVTDAWNGWDVGSSARISFHQSDFNQLTAYIGRAEGGLLYAVQGSDLTFPPLKDAYFLMFSPMAVKNAFPRYSAPVPICTVRPIVTQSASCMREFSLLMGGNGGGLRIYEQFPYDSSVEQEIFAAKLQLQLFPNPTLQQIQIRFDLKESGNISLQVLDMLGRTVRTLYRGTLSEGMQEMQFDLDGLARAPYLLQWQKDTGERVISTFILQ